MDPAADPSFPGTSPHHIGVLFAAQWNQVEPANHQWFDH